MRSPRTEGKSASGASDVLDTAAVDAQQAKLPALAGTMGGNIRFTLPLRTVSLSNSREHWRRKAARTAAERLVVRGSWPWQAHVLCPGECATVVLTRVAPRELDTDNLPPACKAIRDQIAAQLGIDDRTRLVAWLYEQRKGKPYAVEVTVRYGELPLGAAGGSR